MTKHIYVLGSNSFSGSHFIKSALDAGYTVTGVSRSPETHPVFLPYLKKDGSRPPKFIFLQADLNQNLDRLMTSIEKHQPSFVVNFAAQGMVAESWNNPEQWLNTNTVSPVMLYNRLRACEFLEKFVQISTPEVYGSTGGLVKESIHYEPSTPYAVSKAAADMNLMCFAKTYNFPVVFTRAANVFGAGQQLYRIVPAAALRFLSGGILDLHGGGHSVRSFIHIHDVADATLKVMEKGQTGEIYHISTTRQISIRDLVFLVAEIAGVNAEKHIRIVGERLGKDAVYLLDSSAIREKLGWKETISLEQGIEEVVRWVRDNKDTLLQLPQKYQHKI